MYCDICQGRKTIRLPTFRRLEAVTMDHASAPPDVEDLSREFPCPQCCTEQIPYERLAVIKEFSLTEMHTALDEATLIDIQKRQAAHAIVDRIIKDNMLTVEKRPTVLGHQIRMTLGVVAPDHVTTLEERVAERQFEVADEAVDLTIEEIANWGSFYHGRMGGRVDASQAVEWLQTALKKLKAEYGKR